MTSSEKWNSGKIERPGEIEEGICFRTMIGRKNVPHLQPPRHRCVAVAYHGSESDLCRAKVGNRDAPMSRWMQGVTFFLSMIVQADFGASEHSHNYVFFVENYFTTRGNIIKAN